MSFLGTKTQKLVNNTLYGETEQYHQICKIFSVYFTMLGTKTPKCMQNSLYGKPKRHYGKRELWMLLSFLSTKTLFGKIKEHYDRSEFLLLLSFLDTKKGMNNTLYGETEHYQTCVFWVFFFFSTLLDTKTKKNNNKKKNMQCTLYGERKRYSLKYVFWEFSSVLRMINVKKS